MRLHVDLSLPLALSEMEEKEGHESIKEVFAELGLDLDKFPTEPLEGSWT